MLVSSHIAQQVPHSPSAHAVYGNGLSLPAVPVRIMNATPVTQLGKKKTTSKIRKRFTKMGKEKKNVDMKPPKKITVRDSGDFTSVADTSQFMKLYIAKISKQVDDDNDVPVLEGFKTKADEYHTKAATLNIELKAMPISRLRTGSMERALKEKELTQLRKEMNRLSNALKKTFPMNAGGFGAKARAHGMDANAVSAITPGAGISPFISQIDLGTGEVDKHFTKSSARVAGERAGSLLACGGEIDDDEDFDEKLTEIEDPLQAPEGQAKSFSTTPAGKARDNTQYGSMNNTTAAAYAKLSGAPGWAQQRWEWLHLRGAGLGGATDSKNLVAGTRDANTNMIPFESNIRLLGTAVSNSKKYYTQLNVTWGFNGPVKRHLVQEITMGWELIRADGERSKIRGNVVFNPLDTGNNISKAEVAAIERALSYMRKLAEKKNDDED